jgi:WXG100 family type VII secretion target
METDSIRVSHAGLDRAADDLHAAVRRIDERLDRLEGELAPLRADWTGEAQQAYELARHRWEQAMREMRDVLDATRRKVAESNAEYRSADLRGAAAFGG